MNRCPTCGAEYPSDVRFCPRDGTALVQVVERQGDPLVGQVLAGRYEILSKLGEGGMGSVYAARHLTLGRIDAVKILRPDTADADARRRFLREAKLAASINHPNAVVIHDFGQTESGVTFLAMEYIQGQSLTKLLQQEGPFPPRRVVNIIRQVASALDVAHQLGVIHRDLKPDNIMVMEGDRVKVVDFGIAKAIGGQESLVPMTQVGFVIGTPHYMSPEQVMGSELDARSDVYSLALIAYEMLTGVRAFAGDSMQSQMVARLSEPPRPMAVAAPHVTVPAAVEAVVRQALARLPADRPASAGAFAAQLEKAWLAAENAQAVAAPPSGSVSTQPQRAGSSTANASSPVTAQPMPSLGVHLPAAHEPLPVPPSTVVQHSPPVMPQVPGQYPSAGLYPPAMLGGAMGSAPTPATVVQPGSSPPPAAAVSPSPVLSALPSALPASAPAPSASSKVKTNFWLIGGLVAAAGIVLLTLVVGVVLVLVYVGTGASDSGTASEPGTVPVATDNPPVPRQAGRQPDKSVAPILEQSRLLREKGDYESALHIVDEALAANPTSPELRIEKAEILFEQEHYVESEDLVYAVLRSHPDYAPAYQNLGVLQYRQKKIAEAIASQKRCLELNPELEYASYAHASLAQIYAEQYFSDKRKFASRSNEAEMEARWALSTATRKSLEVYPRLTLATLLIDRQQYALAREQLEKLLRDDAFRKDQERALAYYQLAVVAFSERNYAEAAEAAERAAQLNPQDEDYQKLARELRRYRG
jgi:serine/threonine-protein kinase